MAQARRSPVLAVILGLLALVCAAAAVFYFTQKTDLFAGNFGKHPKHAAIFAVLTLVFLAGAVLARPRSTVG